MRGAPQRQMATLTTLRPGDLIPADHPIRRIRAVVDTVLAEFHDEFSAMYSSPRSRGTGRLRSAGPSSSP
jgi:hypothetical protein